jgi:hypothetical protein
VDLDRALDLARKNGVELGERQMVLLGEIGGPERWELLDTYIAGLCKSNRASGASVNGAPQRT